MWSGISRFFGNLTGGAIGESDAERRRREEAERRRQAQQSQKQTSPIRVVNQPLQNQPQVQQGFGVQQAAPMSQNIVQPLSLAKAEPQAQQSPLKIDESVISLPGLGGRYIRQADGTYKTEQGQTKTSEQVDRLRQIYREDQSRQAAIAKEGITAGNILKEFVKAPVTIGKHLGAGMQQVGSSVVDTAIQGGGVLDELAVQLRGGSEEEKNRRRMQNLRNTAKLRGVLHSGKDLLGEELVGNRDVDEAAGRIASGNASARDFLQVGGKSLDVGLGATMLFNPTRQLASGIIGKATNKEVVQFALRDGLFFGTGDAIAAGSQVYGQTGDIKDAVKTASLAFLMSGGAQFGLDVGGQAAGRAIRGGANATKNAVASAGANSMSGFVKAMKTNLVRDAIRRAEANLGRPLTNEERNATKKALESEIEAEWQEVQKEQKAVEAEGERQQQEQPAPGNAIDQQAYLAELQRRRQAFEQNPELAETLELQNTRQREASYDPSTPVDRMNVAEKLTQLGIKSSDLRKLNEAGGNARIYQQILEQMEARGFVPDNPVAYIRGALNKIKEQNRYNPTLAAMNRQATAEPAVNDMGEVITDQNGRPLSKEEYERLTNQEARQEDGQVNRVVNDAKPDPETVEPRPTKPVEKAEQIAEEQGKTVNHGKSSETDRLFEDFEELRRQDFDDDGGIDEALETDIQNRADKEGLEVFYNEDWGGHMIALKDTGSDMKSAGKKMQELSKRYEFDVEVNPDGTIRLYHGTDQSGKEAIVNGSFEDGSTVFLSPSKEVEYGGVNGAGYYGDNIIAVDVDPRKLIFNPSGEFYVDNYRPDSGSIKVVESEVDGGMHANALPRSAETEATGRVDLTDDDITNLRADVDNALAEAGFDDVEITGIQHIGSTKKGTARDDSDLDILVTYRGDAREDDVFNALAAYVEENKLDFDGRKIDFNPVPEGDVDAIRSLTGEQPEAPRNTTIDSQGNTVDTKTGEILDGPNARPTPEPETPPKTYRTVEDMVNKRPTDGTYQSEKAFVRDVDAYAQRTGQRVEEQLAKDGGDFEGMFDHVDGLWQRWAAGEKNLSVKDIDPKYRKAYIMLRKELDKMYGNRKGQDLEGRAKGDEITGDQGPLYIPHRSTQEGGNLSTLDELDGLNRDWSTLSRTTGQMADVDKSTNFIRKYAIEMLGGNKVMKAEKLVEQSKVEVKDGIREVELTPEKAMETLTKREQVMDNLGDAAALKNKKNLAKMDVVKEFEELGTASGYKKNVIDAKMDDAFYKEAYRRLGSVQSNGKPIDRDAGISQYYGAESDARALMDSMKKKDEIGQVVIDHLKKDMNYMSDAEITEIIGKLDRDLGSMAGRDLSPEEVTALRHEATRRALEGAARVNMTNFLQRTEMADPGLRRVMNIHARNMLVNGRARNTLVTKIASLLTNAQDMALRGWNLKSAAVEFSDISNMISMYGVKTAGRAMKDVARPGAMKDMLAKYGRSNSYAVHREMLAAMKMKSKDLDDFYQSIADKNTKKTLEYIKNAADPRMMIKAAEIFKQAAALRAAEIKFTPIAKQKGWSQVELHRAIRDEARRTALTNDQESFLRIQENPIAAASFQYWQWNIRFMAQNGRLISGRENLGTLKDRKSRARYGAYQLAQRTALWTALSASGSSVAYSFGVFDPFGIFEDNWDGIDDDDMTATDTVMQYGSISPLTSLVGSAYFAHRQEQERSEAFANDDERKQGVYGYRERRKDNEAINSGEKLTPEQKEAQRQDNAKFDLGNVIDNFQSRTPFGNMLPGTTQARKTAGAHELNKKGYSESRDGRVQYQAPEKGSFDYYMSYVFGKSATDNAQEYYDRPKPFEAMKKGDLNGFINELRKDTFFSSSIGKLIGSTKNPERPLTNSFDGGFNKKALDSFKAAVEKSGGVHTKESRDALSDWIEIGRKYNRVLDNFKKDDPTGFAKWQETFDQDIISPEKWAIYAKNPKVWEFARERKKLEAKHLGRVVDPVFELDAAKAKVVMEERSMPTGDDMMQRTKLYKYDWYEKFKQDEQKYYDQFGSEDADEPNRGARAKEWFGYSKSLFELRKDKKNFPAVSKFYEIQEKHGYESDQMKAFWNTPEGNAYQDEKIKYDEARLEIVNKMRKIEGAEPLTWEQFRVKLEFEEPADEDDGKSNGYWKDGKFYKTGGYRKGGGRSGGGSAKERKHRTGVEDTVSSGGSTPGAIKQVRAKPSELKDARKAFKKPRATGMSKIRVRI